MQNITPILDLQHVLNEKIWGLNRGIARVPKYFSSVTGLWLSFILNHNFDIKITYISVGNYEPWAIRYLVQHKHEHSQVDCC
jgi:hypothetical protein